MGFQLLISILLIIQNDPLALVNSARTKLRQVGALATQGRIAEATELTQSTMADFDRAVDLAPDNPEVRLARGVAYATFPAYYNKSSVAREDLEAAARHPDWRERALAALERLEAAEKPVDRLPEISPEISPLVVVLTITFPAASYREQAQARTTAIARAVEGFPGLLGTHLVASIDKPGMFIIMTWWKSKKEANDFYYSSLHRGWMQGRGQAITNAPNIPPEQIPTQVSVEVFGVLPGGLQMNGGLLPK